MREIWQNRQDCTSHCEDCPGCDAPYPLGGIGNPDSPVMLVGQEPAYNVDNDRVDLMEYDWRTAHDILVHDRQSSMNPLWKHMMNVGLAVGRKPDDLYFTNAAKCNDKQSTWEKRVNHCQPYLAREVGVVDPDIVLLYGTKVVDRVFGMFGIEWSGTLGDVHGEVFETSSTKLVPLYHWGYIYRIGDLNSYREQIRDVLSNVP